MTLICMLGPEFISVKNLKPSRIKEMPRRISIVFRGHFQYIYKTQRSVYGVSLHQDVFCGSQVPPQYRVKKAKARSDP